MTEKRFKITKSKLVENAYVIEDEKKQFTFPTLVGDNRGLIAYEKALNELSEENEKLKKKILEEIDLEVAYVNETYSDGRMSNEQYNGAIISLGQLREKLE